nr:GH25 family lysozyme [Lactobacillus jensenii]
MFLGGFIVPHFRHRSTLPLIIISLICVICALFFAYRSLPKRTTLPTGSNLSVVGVKLDQYRDSVDLHKLQAAGISFVYLRATQGKSYFDDEYDRYRSQIQGTNLAFGSVLYFSDESTVKAQYRYFNKKTNSNTGSLPILLEAAPGSNSNKLSFWKHMGQLATLFLKDGKSVMVQGSIKYKKYFPISTKFMSTDNRAPNKLQYAFWRYTNKGHVKNVEAMEYDVEMYACNGTMGQYKQLYGDLTQ